MVHARVVFLISIVFNQILNSTEESEIIGVVSVDCELGVSTIDGNTVVDFNEHVEIYVHGKDLQEDLQMGISDQKTCEYVNRATFQVLPDSDGHLAVVSFVVLPQSQNTLLSVYKYTPYYICMKSEDKWVLQCANKEAAFYARKPILSTMFQILLIVSCFLLSALLTGLNLGVLSLDMIELTLFKNAGTKREQSFAKKLIPIRKRGNFFLCSIVIAATLCNSVATITLNRFTGTGYITVIITTCVVVLMCEILPQAMCTYFPLSIAGYTVYITMACMLVTSPVSYPLAMLLNYLLHKELANRFTKSRLREFLKLARIPADEEKIISGALDLNYKMVENIMTPLDDIFKLPIDAVMDFETIASIIASGYSRIPIYDGTPSNICHVLLTKELVLLDPGKKVSIKNLIQDSQNFGHIIPRGTTLDQAYLIFKDSRDHMAFIVDKDETTEDEEKHVIGLVTFEDIIEEIFQWEINDETDKYSDNQSKRKLSALAKTNELLPQIKIRKTSKGTLPSQNLKLSTFHFLSGIDSFSEEYISSKILMCLLDLDVFCSTSNKKLPKDHIYVADIPADYFIMLIEGRMEVILEPDLSFEIEPFRHFGIESLHESPFIPDYTLRAVKESVYLKVPKPLYDAAVLLTRQERFNENPSINVQSELFRYYKMLSESNNNVKSSE